MTTGVLRQQMVLSDWDQLIEAVQPWDVSGCIATDRHQPFQANVRGIAGESFYAIRVSLNRRLRQSGATPEGFASFAVMTSTSTPARFRGHDAYPRIGLTPDHEFEGASEAGFDVILFGFAEAAYQRRFGDSDQLLGRLETFGKAMLESDPTRVRAFEALTNRLISGEKAEGSGEHEESLLRNALFQGLEDLVQQEQGAGKVVPSTVARRRALRRGLDFIEGNLKNTVSISDICNYAAASERTLEYAFREYCGVTPKTYLNARRLHAFREALREPRATSVSGVAGEFGYWHMGKLAGDYRATFGELPSETLRGSAGVRNSDA
jgi:AraC family ethanolamine operon transcriptional activator